MENLLFIKPCQKMRERAIEYKNEHMQNGETVLSGSALFHTMEYDDWLRLTIDNTNKRTVHADWVVSSTFFVVRSSDDKIIGMVDIRHYLNEFLASYGGHIGYGVRPSERQKGYATIILRMALEYAKLIGLNRVMLGCNADNTASRKTILKCGGIKEMEYIHTDGKLVQIYWIDI